MRIYGKFENVGSEYDMLAPVKISLNPIEGTCMYLDLEEGKEYESAVYYECEELKDWKIYSGEIDMGEYLYNPKTGEYINSQVVGLCPKGKDTYVELKDGRTIYRDEEYNYRGNITFAGGYESDWQMYQDYKEGKPVGKPRFEEI